MFPTDNVICLLWPFRYPSDTLASEFSEHLTLTTPSPGPRLVSAVTSNHNHTQPTAGLCLLSTSLLSSTTTGGVPQSPRDLQSDAPTVSPLSFLLTMSIVFWAQLKFCGQSWHSGPLNNSRVELRRSIYARVFFNSKYYSTGLPRWLSGKEPTCQCKRPKTWVWSPGGEDTLEKGMATHSCILAWRIPWTEKPGRLQSMGVQRVRHDWSDLACTQAL